MSQAFMFTFTFFFLTTFLHVDQMFFFYSDLTCKTEEGHLLYKCNIEKKM